MVDSMVMSVITQDTTWPDQVVFTVNGQDLRELAGPLAEDMSGPPSTVIATYPDQLLGGPDHWELDSWYELRAILGCACGQPGCAAVLVRISVHDDSVEWSEFQRDRDKGRIPVGPFRFARVAYEAEVAKVVAQAGGSPPPWDVAFESGSNLSLGDRD